MTVPLMRRFTREGETNERTQQADQALIPTERFAQQVEKIVNGELSADKKKQ
jgi:hypothetical protein